MPDQPSPRQCDHVRTRNPDYAGTESDRPRWQGVSRRGLTLGSVGMLAVTLVSTGLLLYLIQRAAPTSVVALTGVVVGLILGGSGGIVLLTFTIARHDRRMHQQWETLTKTRHGGSLWSRRNLPQRDDMPGWKVARIVGPEPAPKFVGLAFGRYETVSTAACAHHDHDAPDPACTCGFYAFYRPMRARWAWRGQRDAALLHVEGYGLAIEHELGWRAARQEILTVILAPRCQHCPRRAAGLTRTPLFDEWTPTCSACARRKERTLYTPVDLAHMWGTEVAIAKGIRWGWRAPRLRNG